MSYPAEPGEVVTFAVLGTNLDRIPGQLNWIALKAPESGTVPVIVDRSSNTGTDTPVGRASLAEYFASVYNSASYKPGGWYGRSSTDNDVQILVYNPAALGQSMINLLIALFIGMSVGANVVVARNLGGQRPKIVNRAVHTAILLALVCGTLLGIFGFVMAHQLLVWMSSPEDVISLSTIYLRIYFLGMPATLAYNFGAAILRAQGDTKRPLYYLIVAGIVNVILNLFTVLVLNMDVAGVATATTISQYISAGLILRCLSKDEGPLRLDWKKLKIDRVILGQILSIGLPAGFQGIVFSLSNVLIQSSINSFGSTVVAGSAASSNIENFVYQAMNAFYQTNLTFTGQNYGAGECRRVDKSLLYCQGFVILTGLVLGNLAYFFGHSLVSIYNSDEAVIEQGIIRLGYIARTYALCGIMDTMVGSLRGLGYSIVPMIVSLIGACGLRIVWIFTIFQMDRTPENLYISYPISWAVTPRPRPDRSGAVVI